MGGERMTVDSPTLADQVSKLYELIAGYHATHMVDIGRELGALGRPHQNSRAHLRRARRPPRHRPVLHRNSVPDRFRIRTARPRWDRLADGAALRPDPRRSRLKLLPGWRRRRAYGGGQGLSRLHPPFPGRHGQAIPGARRVHHAGGGRGARKRCPASSSMWSYRGCLPSASGSCKVAGSSTWDAAADGPWFRSPSDSPRSPVSASM